MQYRSRGPRPRFFADPRLDQFHVMLVALTQEVSVLRDRLDTVERLLEANGTLARADIEAYEPGDAAAEARFHAREAYIQRVMRVHFEEAAQLASADPRFPTVDDVVAAVSN